MADELLSCPFCGGEARISRAHQNKMLAMGEVPTDEHYLFTLYHDCANGITICWTYKPKDALIAAWNRRTPPTPATDEREAVARALCIAGEEDDFNYKGYLELADAALSALAPIRERERKAEHTLGYQLGVKHATDTAAAVVLAAEARGREVEAAAIMDWLCDTYDPDDEHDERLDIAQAIEVVRHIKHGEGK